MRIRSLMRNKSRLFGFFSTLFLLLLLSPCAGQNYRANSLAKLKKAGFTASSSLPPSGVSSRKLRPQAEIEGRLHALRTYIIWVAGPDGYDLADLKKRGLSGVDSAWLTEDEKAVMRLEQPVAREQHLDSIGWQMENMWALAWVLGFDTEPALSGQLQGDLARQLVFRFSDPENSKKLRSLQQVVQMEDLFYCAHNAVRSAQLGGQTVPSGYHPVAEGGGVHERRHSLTWCLSPGVEWEETDLST